MGLDDTFRARCPSCDMLVDSSESRKFLPFCSERCRLVDLGRWLNEEHTLPVQAEDEEEQSEESVPGGETRRKPQLPPGWHDA
ncbi:MAG: DNA gyrase inhibitor YacG [Planctomycetota bacterium]